MQYSADTSSPKRESLNSDIKEIQCIAANEGQASNVPAVVEDLAMKKAVNEPISLALQDFPVQSADALLLSAYNIEDAISPIEVAPSDFNEFEIFGAEQKSKYDLEPELCANTITEVPYDKGIFTSEWGINAVNDVESTVESTAPYFDSLRLEPTWLDALPQDNTPRKLNEIHENEIVKENVLTNECRDDNDDDKASKSKINIGGCIYSDVEFSDDSDSDKLSGAGKTGESNDESNSSGKSSGIANEDNFVEELLSMETTGETRSLHHSVT